MHGPDHERHAFMQALLSVDRTAADRLVQARADRDSPVRAVEELIGPALEQLGLEWEKGTVALSQIYMAGRICEGIVDALLPPSAIESRADQPRIGIAVVADRHMLGKRIVCSTLRAAGWAVRDYGAASADALAARALQDGLDILLLSALMLPSALEVKQITARLPDAPRRIRVVVGGAPFLFDGRLWQEVGADAWGRTAGDAVAIVRRLSGGIAPC
jgi:methanogenic corrinoid protein MtbC1